MVRHSQNILDDTALVRWTACLCVDGYERCVSDSTGLSWTAGGLYSTGSWEAACRLVSLSRTGTMRDAVASRIITSDKHRSSIKTWKRAERGHSDAIRGLSAYGFWCIEDWHAGVRGRYSTSLLYAALVILRPPSKCILHAPHQASSSASAVYNCNHVIYSVSYIHWQVYGSYLRAIASDVALTPPIK
jgi:hypothetical protein